MRNGYNDIIVQQFYKHEKKLWRDLFNEWMTDIVHYIVYIALHKKHNYVCVCQKNTKVDTLIDYGYIISIPIVLINKKPTHGAEAYYE